MNKWILSFFAGILTLSFFSELPSFTLTGSVVGLAMVWLGWCRCSQMRYSGLLRLIGNSACGISLGLAWIYVFAFWQQYHTLAPVLEGKPLLLQGYIATVPERTAHGQRFEFVPTALIQPITTYLPGKIRLTWTGQALPMLIVGDKWQLAVKLKRPNGVLNPGGFDYEKWLFQRHISAVGYVRKDSLNQLLGHTYVKFPLEQIRQFLSSKIRHVLFGDPYLGFISALLVGIRDDITQAQWQVLRNTGTNHLFAIAGLHIGLISSWVFFLINALWRRSERLMLWRPAKEAALIGVLIIAGIYAGLAGFALPTQRAIMMAMVFLGSTLLRRNFPAWQALLIALGAVLLLDPLVVLAESFWLSFTAVALIIYGLNGRLHPQGWWWAWGRTQWVIALGLIPLSLLFFQQVALLGFIANALAIPWVGFIVLPAALLGLLLLALLPPVGQGLLLFAKSALGLFWPLLQGLGSFKVLQWYQAVAHPVALLFALGAVLLLLAPPGLPLRWFGLIWCLPLLVWLPENPQPGELRLAVLDVGQGLAAVVRTTHYTLVFDTGPGQGEEDAGETILTAYLHNQGVKQIDALVVSHGDQDHIGGAAALLKNFPIAHIYTSVPQRFTPEAAKTSRCWQGQQWQWDKFSFEFLYPPPGQENLNNDNSCVLRIAQGKHSILLPGDIEKKSEHYLLENHVPLQATILVAPHHGSKTSSTADFVAAVQPQYVLYAVGYRNRYHLPHPSVLTRYQQIAALAYDTPSCGAIEFVLHSGKPVQKPNCYRHNMHRYWHRISR